MTESLELSDDESYNELVTVQSIFEEFSLTGPHSGEIDIEVSPLEPVKVSFKLTDTNVPEIAVDEYLLAHLPPLHATFELPSEYPQNKAPTIGLSSCWLGPVKLDELKADLISLWEELKDQAVFSCIDQLRTSADDLFQQKVPVTLTVPQWIKLEMLDYNSRAIRKKFDEGTFDCGICLEPKKGAVCFRLHQCKHVFCKSCLQDYFNTAIEEGDVASVHCLEPDCGEDKREEITGEDGKLRKTPRKAAIISPSELRELLEEDKVARYLRLVRNKALELNKNQVYCPRKPCGGPGRRDNNDKLAICMDCSFAFCADCGKSWHGPYVICRITHREKSKEEEESEKYIEENTTPCPTCVISISKTAGCNHMLCTRCKTHFCCLCGAFLDPSNPFSHFNIANNACYGRLWEGADIEGMGNEQFRA